MAVEPLCARVHFLYGGVDPRTTAAVCVRHVHCASKHRVSSVLLGLCAVGFWAPVCRLGFTSGSAAVACKQMGFMGASGYTNLLVCFSP